MKTTVTSLEGSRQGLFVNGEFLAPKSCVYLPSYDPTTAEPWYEFAQGDAADVDAAVRSAKAAFLAPAWRRLTQTERGKLLRRLGELVLENADELAMIECCDNGKLLKEMRAQMRAIPDSYLYFAGMADKLLGETIPVNKLDQLNFNLREPIGVVGMIIPWNSPLMMLTGTLAPCLAIGNTIVVKPSEHATASSLALAELAIEAGIPPGVVNVVTGDGATTGEALARHAGIAKYVFTGSTFTGRKIAGNAAQNLVPCQMELGGKSPHVVFSDVDVDRAVNGVVSGVFAAAGQTCVAGSRCFVERPVYDRFALVERTRRIKVGHPQIEETDIGPVALAAQLAKVEDYVASGIWTKDIDRAMRFAREIDAGTVWINTYRSAAYMSANGGMKNSGYGRRGGFEVMREFSRMKNVLIDYSGAMQDPFVIRLR